jgi:competence protein ComEC
MQNPKDQEKNTRLPFQGFLPFFWLALAVLGGIWFADWLATPIWLWGVGSGLSLLLWILALTLPKNWTLTHNLIRWTQSDRRLPGAILAAFFFLAGWRYSAVQPAMSPELIAFYNGRGMVQLLGEVVRPPDVRDNRTNLVLRVDSLILLDEPVPAAFPEKIKGKVMLQVPIGEDWAYGDLLRAQGSLVTPFEIADFSYKDYLARKDVYSMMPYARVERMPGKGRSTLQSWIYQLRDNSLTVLNNLFPSPEADLLAGILLGMEQGLSANLQDAFKRTGTTHIIAISGFNMTILAGLFMGVFTRIFGRRWGALTAIFGISIYTVFVGGEAAVVRAAIMGGLGVMGGMFGRRQSGLNSLGLAVFGMLLLDPNLPWDIGFQLSAAATLGLVLYAQPLEEKVVHWLMHWLPEERAHKVIGPLSEFFLFTLAAQMMTLPIIIYHFGGFSWITFLANPLILPPQTLVLILGGMALLSGLILPGLGALIAIVTLPFVRYTIRMVVWLARLPGSELTLPKFHPLWLGVFFGCLFFLTLFSREQQKKILTKIQPARAGMLLLAGLVFLVWTNVLIQPDGQLHLTLLDCEGTLLIQSPTGDVVLIGGGSSPSYLKQVLGERLATIKPRVRWVIVASPTQADLNGLMGGISPDRVEGVLWGIDPYANQTSRRAYAQFSDGGVPLIRMVDGQSLHLANGLFLSVLAQKEKGTVLWLEWDHFSAMLPSGKVGEDWLDLPRAPDVLLLPDDVSSADFPLSTVNAWSPAVILLPLHESNMPLLGEHDLIALLEGYPLVNSLDKGWISISTDGSKIWVDSEK